MAGFNITDVGEAKRLFSRVQALRPERQAETKEETGAKAGRRGSAGKGGLFGKVSGKLGGIFGRKKKPAQRERMEIGHVMKVSYTEDVHRRFEQRRPTSNLRPPSDLSPADIASLAHAYTCPVHPFTHTESTFPLSQQP